MGIFQRKYGLPIYVTRRTYEATRRNINLGALAEVRFFTAGETLTFDHLSVETIGTPHDAADGVAFVVDDDRCRFGLLTDLGHVFAELLDVVHSLDAVMIESNYDESMLRGSSYPEFLKRRISGRAGHLSNFEAARLLEQAASAKLQWACLAHLSEENNDPRLALATHREVLGEQLPLSCAHRQAASGMMRLADSQGPRTPSSRNRTVQPLLNLR